MLQHSEHQRWRIRHVLAYWAETLRQRVSNDVSLVSVPLHHNATRWTSRWNFISGQNKFHIFVRTILTKCLPSNPPPPPPHTHTHTHAHTHTHTHTRTFYRRQKLLTWELSAGTYFAGSCSVPPRRTNQEPSTMPRAINRSPLAMKHAGTIIFNTMWYSTIETNWKREPQRVLFCPLKFWRFFWTFEAFTASGPTLSLS